ncbi:MAG: putative DNA binding domain-containing protein [Clostridiales bacterium]|nr:putative DNA binding domain-containing protein [Clostridiales bacterium]
MNTPISSTFNPDDFDTYREDNRLEAKAANGGLPGTLWDTYSSFANTYGGCIVCGAVERKDGSWKTTGLKDLNKIKKAFWDTIHDKKKVSLCLLTESDVDEYEINGDVVLVIRVPRASRSQKPIYLNNDVFGSTFRRDHEGDYHCTEAEVRAMIRDASEETPDQRVLLDKSIDGLFNDETVKSYRTRYNIKHPDSAWTELDDKDFLVQIGAADDENGLHPTVAGLLMFGIERKITKEYPEYFLDYREHLLPDVRWTDRIYSQEPEWSGNVFDFYSRVSAKLVLDLKKPFKLVDMVRVDETPQHDAVREALVNCLVNTDFYQSWSVVIEKYPDKIVLANPGTIITGKKQMLKGGISQPRNKGLFKMFNLIGLGEHAGSGVPDIYKAWRDVGLQAPEVEEKFGNPDRTILTLPLVSDTASNDSPIRQSADLADPADLNERHKQILSVMEAEREYSTNEIADLIGLKSSRTRQLLKELVGAELLESTGSTNGKRYIRRASADEQLERAEAIMANNPVLAFSPGDLRREGKSIDEYLSDFTKPEQEFYRDYYEDEI